MQTKITLSILIPFFFLLLTAPLKLNSHTYRVPLIVDTDMALDDARALILLFNRDMADTRLIVTSDGAVSPETGYRNLVSFCRYRQKAIKLAMGRKLHKKSPPWREWSGKIFSFAGTGVSVKKDNLKPAADAIVETLHSTENSCVYLCLGPLTNLADALKTDSRIREKISRVIYYGTPPGTAGGDWNTGRDLLSAQRVFRSGLKIMTLSNPGIKNLKFDTGFVERIKALKTPAANLILKLHSSPVIKKLLSEDHFRMWDDITVIYLNRPDVFRFEQKSPYVFEVQQYDAAEIYKIYIKLLGFEADSHLPEREVVVLENFPVDPLLFKPDVRPYVKKIIERHGLEEWKACVLTNELHRHLGIYSLIGAKMGIRAREILEAPLDSLQVVSFAGNKPPLSCFNDGLQVSTGASLGRGTITIKNSSFLPAAEFICRDQRLTLRVKEEIVQRIKRDIQAAIKKYGNLTPEYFTHIRKLSIKYWYDLERTKIFDPWTKRKLPFKTSNSNYRMKSSKITTNYFCHGFKRGGQVIYYPGNPHEKKHTRRDSNPQPTD